MGPEHRTRRERLDWQIRNCRKRVAAIEAQLVAIRAEGSYLVTRAQQTSLRIEGFARPQEQA